MKTIMDTFKNSIRFTVAALAVLPLPSMADDSLKPTYGGFIDVYYGAAFTQPISFDRQYTTQAVRNNEFNLNLAFLETKLDGENVRGRFALQAGTSVQSNYSGEPAFGSISGPSLSRMIQEAYAGYRIANRTWIDAGILFSHIGLESFISRDNPTYTRSMVAEFSPYYQAGIRLSHAFNDRVSAQAHLLNGWQNISESNQNKAFGAQISGQLSKDLLLTYNNFLGNESGFRQLHDLVIKYQINESWSLNSQVDLGFQSTSPRGGSGSWHGFTLISRHRISPGQSLAFRIEKYSDAKNILVGTPGDVPFRIWGTSLGFDQALTTQLIWRSEVRAIMADQAIYQTKVSPRTQETLLVSSLGLTF